MAVPSQMPKGVIGLPYSKVGPFPLVSCGVVFPGENGSFVKKLVVDTSEALKGDHPGSCLFEIVYPSEREGNFALSLTGRL